MTVQILQGDALAVLKTLADQSVHCCVTSPPYWGLRNYGADGQIGLEADPNEFIAKLVEVFREVRRVLRADGTAWVNMGDCYATGAGKVNTSPGGGTQGERWAGIRGDDKLPGVGPMTQPNRMPIEGLKPKDLCGMPWRLAFALQADCWYLRQDIIWHKPNPMPESVTDRCTKAHEYLFLLSKSERYYYDNEAVKEACAPAIYKTPDGWDTSSGKGGHGSFHKDGREKGRIPGNKSHKGTTAYHDGDERMRTKAGLVDYAARQRSARDGRNAHSSLALSEKDRAGDPIDGTRNKRSVWTVATQPFKEAHFATFPPALIEPCILAGCPIGGTVLDPFFGAGTTGLVSDRLQRDCIGIELNSAYADMARNRINADSPLFAAVE